ncbi:hypothetical protein L249_3423 [Ophiocordyceps polyrhachis-furcata BCC 54312]|uniref:Uncharacterized protein n=1 Tax=Ophiocordyceps polyrhachis-furcata BCC 54312 TaxID=1330021 RepID=A0A367LMH3_9HYPO|nr:hypothetical protein L249_3423 [Ophiocordyceps polyrhachis-furcata BCC 54312]
MGEAGDDEETQGGRDLFVAHVRGEEELIKGLTTYTHPPRIEIGDGCPWNEMIYRVFFRYSPTESRAALNGHPSAVLSLFSPALVSTRLLP